MKIKYNYHTLITVKRTNGDIEIVKYTGVNASTLAYSKDMQDDTYKATRDAGNGNILKFEAASDERDATLLEQRAALVDAKVSALYMWGEARERDFNNDIGMLQSSKLEIVAKDAEQAIKDFDIANPDVRQNADNYQDQYATGDLND